MKFSLKKYLISSLFFIAFFATTQSVSAATLTVDTTADGLLSDGFCSLHEAVSSINNGADGSLGCVADVTNPYGTSDRIEFNLPGSGIQTITPTNSYLLTTSVTIDAETQPLAACGVASDFSDRNLLIEISGISSGVNSLFNFIAGSDGSVIRGLQIADTTDAAASGISVSDIGNIAIECNHIDGNVGGGVAVYNSNTVTVDSNLINANLSAGAISINPGSNGIIISNNILSNNRLGIVGSDSSNINISQNIINSSLKAAIQMNISSDITLDTNSIGTDPTGSIAVSNLTNETGIVVEFSGSDDITLTNNVISGNDNSNVAGVVGILPLFSGAFTPTTNLVMQNNKIGVTSDGTTVLSNNSNAAGIYFLGADNVLIGGTGVNEGNIIQGHKWGIAAVEVPFLSSTILENFSILGNSIFNNEIGIDYMEDPLNSFNPANYTNTGPNVNDVNDVDTGPNDYLNYPIIYNAVWDPNGTLALLTDDTTTFNYYLDAPAGDYRIEFFENSVLPSNLHGEGEIFLGFQNITHTGSGFENFFTTLPVTSGVLVSITATERNVGTTSTFGSTSEFGNTIIVESAGVDLGDAPDTGTGTSTGNYQTAIADNGPYHLVSSTVTTYLGDCIDADVLGGTVSGLGNADDIDATYSSVGACASNGDDEDSVVFPTAVLPGETFNVDITTTLDPGDQGELFVWFDFNKNGSFEDTGEQVYNSHTDGYVTNGITSLNISVPSTAQLGNTYVRIRLNTRDINGIGHNLSSIGESLDGEVEDYTIYVGYISTQSSSNSSSGGGIRYICKDPLASNYDESSFGRHKKSFCNYSDSIEITNIPALGEGGLCPSSYILTQNLRTGARNGQFNNYTGAIVNEVKILQSHMNRLGFASGKEDGILGPITDGAIKRMQIFLGTVPDGMVGPITRSLINNSCDGSETESVNGQGDFNGADDSTQDIQCFINYTRPIRFGSVGADVAQVQTCMNSLGYSTGVVDGRYGLITYKGITQYQKAMGLKFIDGIVGPETSFSLNNL